MQLFDIWLLVTCLVVNDAFASGEGSHPPDADGLEAPSAPRKVSAKVVSPTSVKIKWRDPDVQKLGQGQSGIQGRMYIVGYGSPASNIPFKTFVTKQRRLTLVNLDPGIVYDVTVRVVTQVLGPWSKVLKVQIDKKENDSESSTEVLTKKLKAKDVTLSSVLLTWQLHNPSNQIVEGITVTVEPSDKTQPGVTTTLSGKTWSHTVKGLKPSTQYIFTVHASTVNKVGKTKGVQITAVTKGNVPSKAPRYLRLRVLNSTVLSVRWQTPPLRSRHGPLIGYRIQYKRQGAKKDGIVTLSTSKNTRFHRIEDLQRGQAYKVRVAAFNKEGEGPYTKWKPVLVSNRIEKDKKGDKDEKGDKDNKGEKDKRGDKDKDKKGEKDKEGDRDKDKKGDNNNKKRDKKQGDVQRKNGRDGKDKKDTDEEKDGMMERETGDDVEGANATDADVWPGVDGQNVSKEEMMNTTEDIQTEAGEDPADQRTTLSTSSENIVREMSPPGAVRILKVTPTTLHLAWVASEIVACCPVLAYRVEVRNLKDFRVKRTLNRDTNVSFTGLEPDTRYSVQVTAMGRDSESQPSEAILFQTTQAVPPEIRDAGATRAVLGRTANLSCLVYGEEQATIQWLLKDTKHFVNVTDAPWINLAQRTVVTSSNLGPNMSLSSLLLYNITDEAERDFACVASNSAGSDQEIISLIVEESPAILSSRGMHVMVETAAQLECAVKGKPLPDVSWIHTATGLVYRERDQRNRAVNDYVSSVTEGTDVRRSFLVIERTSLSQEGTYTCVAVSSLGRAEANVSLDVLVPPPPPVRKIQAIPLSPSRVSVNWLPPLDYPYTIRYYQVSIQDAQMVQLGIIQTTRVGAELSNLLPNSTYFIGVTAATEHGLGDTGPEVRVMTLSNLGLEPADVSVEAVNSTSIQVNWKRPSAIRSMYIRGYNIYMKPWREPQVKSYRVRGQEEHFVIELGEATQYELRMSTLTTWGFEAFTAWSKVRKPQKKLPPKPVRDISATSIKSKSLVVRWREPKINVDPTVHPDSNQILAYSIGYSAVGTLQNINAQEIAGKKRQLQLNGLEPDTTYKIFVKALGRFGTSESAYLNVKTKSLPPTMVLNPIARAISSTKIHLRWSAPKRGPVTRYHIRYWRPGHKDKQSAWMSGNYRDYIAGSLRKNSNYRFEVIPYNEDVLGEGIVIFSSTLPDRPDGPPTQVKLLAVDAKTFEASWSPPDPDTTNGKIVGYRLVLKAKNGRRVANFEVEANRRNFTFLNMKVSGGFKLRMAAVNANGTGVFSQPVEISYNQATVVPAPPANVKVIPSVSALTLLWDEPKFTGSPTLGYIVGYGQFIPDVFRTALENSQTTHIIKNLKPNSEYIVSVRSFNSIGESKPTFLLTRTKPIPLKPIPLESPLKLTVLADSPTSLSLTWIDPARVKYPTLDDKRFYQIRYSSINGEAYSYINTSNTALLLKALERSTVYETSVRVIRGNESSDWSHPAVNSTQQLVPGGPPTAIVTSPVPGKPMLLHLNWSEPSQPHGIIESYVIYLSADPSLDPNQWVILETHLRKVTIRKLTPYIPYYLKLQAKNKAGFGPLSDLMVYVPPINKKAQPTILSVSNVYGNGSASIRLTWKAPEKPKGPITGYMIYYVKSDDNIYTDWMIQFERGLDGIITGLNFNTTYFIKVRSRYADSSGPFSDRVNYTTLDGSLSEGLDSENISPDNPPIPLTSKKDMVQKDVKQEPANPNHIPNKDAIARSPYVSRDRVSAENDLTSKDMFKTGVPNADLSVHGQEHINDRSNNSSESTTASASSTLNNESKGHMSGERYNTENDRESNKEGIKNMVVDDKKRKVRVSKRKGNKKSNDDDVDDLNGRRKILKKKDRRRKRKLRKKKEKRRREKMRRFGKKNKSNLKNDEEPMITFSPMSTGKTGKTSPTTGFYVIERTSSSMELNVASPSSNKRTKGLRNVESSTAVDSSSTANVHS